MISLVSRGNVREIAAPDERSGLRLADPLSADRAQRTFSYLPGHQGGCEGNAVGSPAVVPTRLSVRRDSPKIGGKHATYYHDEKNPCRYFRSFGRKGCADQLNLRIQQTKLECVPIGEIKPNRRNAKKHPARQILLLVENYKIFGFTQPIIIDENGMILCGHARYFAASRVFLV